jgi:hypothetical protein
VAPAPVAPAPVAPVLPANIPAAPTGAIPTLPTAAPIASPSVSVPVVANPAPDIQALRSAQMRAARNQRQGKLFGRALLAFLLIGALVGGALVFGRAYLFPAGWDPSLTPIVDEVQQARGMEFDHTVPLVVQPLEQYAETVLSTTIGTDWTARLPEWRALGLAGGDVTPQSVGAQLATSRAAVFDPRSDTIYMNAETDPEAATGDLRVAVEEAFVEQHPSSSGNVDVVETSGLGFMSISSPQRLAERAVDRALVGAGSDVAPVTDDESFTVPLPIEYEILASDSLGDALLLAAGTDPGALQLGDPYPAAILGLLSDAPVSTASGLLQPGDRSLADPEALGVDDWSLVWGARLPAATVDELADIVVADSYRPIDRSGTVCFTGVFQTASEAGATTLFDALSQWASAAPPSSQALATVLGPTRVQLEACDPGTDAVAPDPSSAVALVGRQIERLAG